MPQVKEGPAALNSLLERVYDSCIKDGKSRESCSKIAWTAAKRAGWHKDGDTWTKGSEIPENLPIIDNVILMPEEVTSESVDSTPSPKKVEVQNDEDFEDIYDEEDWVEIESKKLKPSERKGLPDSAFCLVKTEKGKSGKMLKIRKFPAHDAAHVRNGFARLKNADLSPADMGKVLSCLKRRAKKFGVEHEEKAALIVEEGLSYSQAVPIEDYVEGHDINLVELKPTKVGAHAYTMFGSVVTFTKEVLEKHTPSWVGGTVSINHNRKIYGLIKRAEFKDPFVTMAVDIVDPILREKVKKQRKELGVSIEADVKTNDNLDIVEFKGTGVSFVFYPEKPACSIEEGCLVTKATEVDKMTETTAKPEEKPLELPTATDTKVEAKAEEKLEVKSVDTLADEDCKCSEYDKVSSELEELRVCKAKVMPELEELRAFKLKVEGEKKASLLGRLEKIKIEAKKYENLPINTLEGVVLDLEAAASRTEGSGAQTGTVTPPSEEKAPDFGEIKKRELRLLGKLKGE